MGDNLPCKNPACKSQGRPHPNCKCYGYAKGGEVMPFCSEHRMHDSKCKYALNIPELMNKSMAVEDHGHAVNGYLAHGGLASILTLGPDSYQEYRNSIEIGHKKIDSHIKSLFSGDEIPVKDSSKSHKQIEDWLEKGGINQELQDQIYKDQEAPQMMAKGGMTESKLEGGIPHNPVSVIHPEQNILLQLAKGNMANYLQALKPQQHAPKLAFDHEPDQREQKRSYNKAIKIADQPLSVLKKIQDGTIEPEHVKYLNALHPELSQALQKKITERIVTAQMDKKKPNYVVRQGLSMLMGVPLSSELSPDNISAAQASLRQSANSSQANTEQPNQSKSKRRTSALTKSDQSFLTGNQALVGRQQKQ